MRSPSPLTPGIRELIGAYVSNTNQYSFCTWPMPRSRLVSVSRVKALPYNTVAGC